MSRWKAGDVARRVGRDGTVTTSLATGACPEYQSHERGLHWHHANGGWNTIPDDAEFGTYSPLIVIDPEDQEQVERLTGSLAAHGANANDRNYWRETQSALRALLPSPKPDEPTGLGAVVEDVDGDLWVRTTDCDFPWSSTDGSIGEYAEIDVVKVLSEGVTR